MRNSVHDDFIRSSVLDIPKSAISAISVLGSGIEYSPLLDYVMQSVFLKMTGYQEQKLKCICWELATNDYDYRYKRFKQEPLGECSCYEEKNTVYKDLIEGIKKYEPDYKAHESIKKIYMLLPVRKLCRLFSNSNLRYFNERAFQNFVENKKIFAKECFVVNNSKGQLLGGNLMQVYKDLYDHRNRCAHNTTSYQQNLPDLKKLIESRNLYRTYFHYFSLLVLLDEIFVTLYKKYCEVYTDHAH